MSAMDALKAAMAAQGKVDPDEVVELAKTIDLDKPEPRREEPRSDAILGERDEDFRP